MLQKAAQRLMSQGISAVSLVGDFLAQPLLLEMIIDEIPAQLTVNGVNTPIPIIPSEFSANIDVEGLQGALVCVEPFFGYKVKNSDAIRGKIAVCQQSGGLATQIGLAVEAGAVALIVAQTCQEWPSTLRLVNQKTLPIPCCVVQDKDGKFLRQVCETYKADGPISVSMSLISAILKPPVVIDQQSYEGLDISTVRSIYELTATNDGLLQHGAHDVLVVMQGIFETMGRPYPYFNWASTNRIVRAITRRLASIRIQSNKSSLFKSVSGGLSILSTMSNSKKLEVDFDEFVMILLSRPWTQRIPQAMITKLLSHRLAGLSEVVTSFDLSLEDIPIIRHIPILNQALSISPESRFIRVPQQDWTTKDIPVYNKVHITAEELQDTIVATTAEFGPDLNTFGIKAKLVMTDPDDLVSNIKNSEDAKGCIAVCREHCGGQAMKSFEYELKALAAQKAGAVALIIVRDSSEWPHYMHSRGWVAKNVRIKCVIVASVHLHTITSLAKSQTIVKLTLPGVVKLEQKRKYEERLKMPDFVSDPAGTTATKPSAVGINVHGVPLPIMGVVASFSKTFDMGTSICKFVVMEPLAGTHPLDVAANRLEGNIAVCKRGVISFVEKAQVAAALGAKALLIIHDNELDDDWIPPNCTTNAPHQETSAWWETSKGMTEDEMDVLYTKNANALDAEEKGEHLTENVDQTFPVALIGKDDGDSLLMLCKSLGGRAHGCIYLHRKLPYATCHSIATTASFNHSWETNEFAGDFIEDSNSFQNNGTVYFELPSLELLPRIFVGFLPNSKHIIPFDFDEITGGGGYHLVTMDPPTGSPLLLNSHDLHGRCAVAFAGEISVSSQVKLAQNAGAIALVVIYDNAVRPDDVYVADSGIEIPCALVSGKDFIEHLPGSLGGYRKPVKIRTVEQLDLNMVTYCMETLRPHTPTALVEVIQLVMELTGRANPFVCAYGPDQDRFRVQALRQARDFAENRIQRDAMNCLLTVLSQKPWSMYLPPTLSDEMKSYQQKQLMNTKMQCNIRNDQIIGMKRPACVVGRRVCFVINETRYVHVGEILCCMQDQTPQDKYYGQNALIPFVLMTTESMAPEEIETETETTTENHTSTVKGSIAVYVLDGNSDENYKLYQKLVACSEDLSAIGVLFVEPNVGHSQHSGRKFNCDHLPCYRIVGDAASTLFLDSLATMGSKSCGSVSVFKKLSSDIVTYVSENMPVIKTVGKFLEVLDKVRDVCQLHPSFVTNIKLRYRMTAVARKCINPRSLERGMSEKEFGAVLNASPWCQFIPGLSSALSTKHDPRVAAIVDLESAAAAASSLQSVVAAVADSAEVYAGSATSVVDTVVGSAVNKTAAAVSDAAVEGVMNISKLPSSGRTHVRALLYLNGLPLAIIGSTANLGSPLRDIKRCKFVVMPNEGTECRQSIETTGDLFGAMAICKCDRASLLSQGLLAQQMGAIGLVFVQNSTEIDVKNPLAMTTSDLHDDVWCKQNETLSLPCIFIPECDGDALIEYFADSKTQKNDMSDTSRFGNLNYRPEGEALLHAAFNAFMSSAKGSEEVAPRSEAFAMTKALFNNFLKIRMPLLCTTCQSRVKAIIDKVLDTFIEDEKTITFCEFLQMLCMQPWYDYLPDGRFVFQLHANTFLLSESLLNTIKNESVELLSAFQNTAPEDLTSYLKELFDMADENNDQVLQPHEFYRLLMTAGFDLTEDEISELVAEVDLNEDGVLDYEEYIPCMAKLIAERKAVSHMQTALQTDPALLETYLKDLFQIADSNGDGALDTAEVSRLLSLSGLKISKSQLTNIMIAADSNMDGVIQFEEFVPMAIDLLRPRLSLHQTLEVMRQVWYWFDMPLPELLAKGRESEAFDVALIFAIDRLGYPRQFGVHVKFDMQDIAAFILSEHWQQYLPYEFQPDKGIIGCISKVAEFSPTVQRLQEIYHAAGKTSNVETLLRQAAKVQEYNGDAWSHVDCTCIHDEHGKIAVTSQSRMAAILGKKLYKLPKSIADNGVSFEWFAENILSKAPFKDLLPHATRMELKTHMMMIKAREPLDLTGVIEQDGIMKYIPTSASDQRETKPRVLMTFDGEEYSFRGLQSWRGAHGNNPVNKGAIEFGGRFGRTRLQGNFTAMDPLPGCRTDIPNPGASVRNRTQLKGTVVLCIEGGISFSEKALAAQAAGAIGVVMIRSEGENMPFIMPLRRDIDIPCTLCSHKDGQRLLGYIASHEKQTPPVSLQGLDNVNINILRHIYERHRSIGPIRTANRLRMLICEVMSACDKDPLAIFTGLYVARMTSWLRKWMNTFLPQQQCSTEGVDFMSFIKLLSLRPWCMMLPRRLLLDMQKELRNTLGIAEKFEAWMRQVEEPLENVSHHLTNENAVTRPVISVAKQSGGAISKIPDKVVIPIVEFMKDVFLNDGAIETCATLFTVGGHAEPFVGINAKFGGDIPVNVVHTSLIQMHPLTGEVDKEPMLHNAHEIKGKAVICKRGGISFSQKAALADEAGALALIVIQNDEENVPIAMSYNGIDGDPIPKTPCCMISAQDGEILMEMTNGSRMPLWSGWGVPLYMETTNLEHLFRQVSADSSLAGDIFIVKLFEILRRPLAPAHKKRWIAVAKAQFRRFSRLNFEIVHGVLCCRPFFRLLPMTMQRNLKGFGSPIKIPRRVIIKCDYEEQDLNDSPGPLDMMKPEALQEENPEGEDPEEEELPDDLSELASAIGGD